MRHAAQWMWGGVVVGLVLRGVHFFRDPAVWHDEAALILNVIGKTFREMLGPLFHAEAAPPLFMMIERAIVQLAGDDGTQTLRIFPFLASCLSLIGFALLSRHLLTPLGAVWAVWLFAGSDRLLWHACEAKPYAIDTLLGVLMTAMFIGAIRQSFARWTFALAISAIPFLWMVFPACFMYGGVLVALLPTLWQRGRTIDYTAYISLVVAVGVGFLTLYLGPITAQRCEAMDSCWVRLFPNWEKPWMVPIWTVGSTLEVVRYVLQPTGQLLIGVLSMGILFMWRSGQRDLLVQWLLPLALVFIAACMHKYPYGCARIIVFAAPGLIWLIGAGIEPSRAWLQQHIHPRFGPWLLWVLLLIPIGQGVGRTIQPWFREDADVAAEYVIAHFSPGEGIAYNKWEYEYYFRELPVAPFYALDGQMPTEKTFWLVIASGREVNRPALVDSMITGYRVLERREFDATTVVKLERPRQPDAN